MIESSLDELEQPFLLSNTSQELSHEPYISKGSPLVDENEPD